MNKLTELERDIKEGQERRARANAMEAAEQKAQQDRVDASQRAIEQTQREKEVREKEQVERDAVAEAERLRLVAANKAAAEAQAVLEKKNYDFTQAHRNATPEEKAESNRKYVEESAAIARKNQAESQARHEEAQRLESEHIAQARREFRERQQVHEQTLQRQREIAEQARLNPDYEAQGGTHMTCPVCGQVGIAKAMPFHKSADFSQTCYWDLPRCVSTQVLTEEAAREIECQRSNKQKGS